MRQTFYGLQLALLTISLTGCSSIEGYPSFSSDTLFPAYPQGDPYYPVPQEGHYGDARSQIVSCSSIDQRHASCAVQLSHKDSVHVIRQDSKAACIQGRDWGTDRGSIWVANGCRATFRIERYYWR